MRIEFTRDKSKVMPTIENPEDVTSVRIWHCNYKSFQELNKCINLEVLEIATLPESDFNFLSNNKKLKYLSIIHLPKVDDLLSLGNLVSLEVLSLQTLPSYLFTNIPFCHNVAFSGVGAIAPASAGRFCYN